MKDGDTTATNKLHTARYAFHCVRRRVYSDAVNAGLLTVDQAKNHYRRAMENYDLLIADAGCGHLKKANDDEMNNGFYL